jgi:ABC-type Mn2+/Zn2+ transport system ATPase subunit
MTPAAVAVREHGGVAHAPAPETGAPLVRADGLAGGYGAQDAVADLTFALAGGQRCAVLGPNGGGKTTLFRLLTGELPARRGTLERPRVAVVPQTERSRLDFPVSALDVALMGAVSRLPWWRRPARADRALAAQALERVGLAEHAGRTFGDLSGGQRQRVLVARALVQDAPVLLMDEPFTGLDARSAERLEALVGELAAEGRVVLIATHEVDQARAWDRVLCLNRRQVAFGVPAEVLDRPTLEATYGAALVEVGADKLALPPHHGCGHDHG